MDDRTRDRPRTEAAILAAAKTVLADKGFSAWGVNAIAREAGCDKQLIYRYFGGLEGLAEAVGTDVALWLEEALSAEPDTPPARTYADLVSRLLTAFAQALRANPLAQRIVAWEVSEPSPLARRFAAARGRAMGQWIARERGELAPPAGVDAPALNAILIAAVQHLVISGAATGAFSGVALATDADWERILHAVARMTAAAYPPD